MNEQIRLNGVEVCAFIRELDDGLRVQLSLDDWNRCRLYRGEQIPLRRQGRPEERLFLAESVEMPPVAWFNLTSTVESGVLHSR